MNQKIQIGAFFLIIIGCAGFFILTGGNQNPVNQNSDVFSASYNTSLGTVSINTKLPESPSSITLYKVVPNENDMAYFSIDNLIEIRSNVTPETEAPKAAEAALIRYGDLPQGAKLVYNKTEYIESENIETNHIISKYPVVTNVQYARFIDDKPVVGPGGFINIDLGNYGELLYLNKVWRTVTPSGSVLIISAPTAIDKINRGDLFGQRPKCACQLNVDKIGLGYYENGRDENQDYLEPVWIFSGNLSSGDPWKYYVYARESAYSSIITTQDPTQPHIQANETPVNYITSGFSKQTDSTNTTVKNKRTP
jgi:hypothetical protein